MSADWGPSVFVEDSLFLGNRSGGLVVCTGSVRRCLFACNQGRGATIHSSGVVAQCVFAGNTGRGLRFYGEASEVSDCVFAGNQGGGLDCDDALVGLANSLFVGNTSNWGGAVANVESSLWASNCTFAGNWANESGAGLWNVGMSNAEVRSAVFWGNAVPTGSTELAQVFNGEGDIVDILYTLVQGLNVYAGPGNVGGDPLFRESAIGYWTETAVYDPNTFQTTFHDASAAWEVDEHLGKFLNPDASQYLQSFIVSNSATSITVWGDFAALGLAGKTYQIRDYHVQPGSPCIDAGDNTAVPAGITTDLDGNSRFVDDPFTPDAGSGVPPIVDMGAYEYRPMAGDLDGDGDVDADDYAAFLVAFGHVVGDPEHSPSADLDGDGMVTLVDYQLWLECYRNYIGDPNAAAPELPKPEDQGGDSDVDTGNIRNVRRLPVQVEREPLGPAPRR